MAIRRHIANCVYCILILNKWQGVGEIAKINRRESINNDQEEGGRRTFKYCKKISVPSSGYYGPENRIRKRSTLLNLCCHVTELGYLESKKAHW